MISKISQISFSANVLEQSSQKLKPQNPVTNRKNPYMDSFVKNAKDTAPILLGLTALWSLLDYGTGKISMAKSVRNNIAFFFAPILIVSSALVAGIENKKTSKSSKPENKI